MDMTVLMPYRYVTLWREQLARWTLRRWREAGFEVVVGPDDVNGRPFNFARALNRAARKATTDGVVIVGADLVPDVDAVWAAGEALERHPWVSMYQETAVLTQASTELLLQDPSALKTPEAIAPFCMGVYALRREVLLDVPMDERFEGWGWEDIAHRHALETLYGMPGPSVGITAYAMWHPPSSYAEQDANRDLFVRDYASRAGDPVAMRELIESLKA